jgi:predicted DNA-binding transcriptional regulator YafY
MGEQNRRVVAGFDDPHDADRARARLESELGTPVEENASTDTEVAFEAMGDRGDSAERQPEITVAVEVPAGDVDEDVRELAEEGADFEVVEPPRGSGH